MVQSGGVFGWKVEWFREDAGFVLDESEIVFGKASERS